MKYVYIHRLAELLFGSQEDYAAVYPLWCQLAKQNTHDEHAYYLVQEALKAGQD